LRSGEKSPGYRRSKLEAGDEGAGLRVVGSEARGTWQTDVMWKIVAILLAAWLVLSVLGLIIKGLFWLFIVGAILFVVTAIFGGSKTRPR
jgi:hypothetical protein